MIETLDAEAIWTPNGLVSLPRTMEDSVEAFLRYGVSFLPLAEGHGVHHLIQPLDKAFGEFLGVVDPSDPKWRLSYERGDEPDTGLFIRHGSSTHDGSYDYKDYFHFRMLLLEHPEFQPFKPWLDDLAELVQRCRGAVSSWLAALDNALPGYDLHAQLCNDSTVNDEVIRQIHYRRTRPDTKVIARRHRGRAGVVLALWENYPGLRAIIDGEWQHVGSLSNYPLVFVGQRLVQLTGGRLAALDHEVIHVKGAEQVARRSIVAFFDPHDKPVLLDTH